MNDGWSQAMYVANGIGEAKRQSKASRQVRRRSPPPSPLDDVAHAPQLAVLKPARRQLYVSGKCPVCVRYVSGKCPVSVQ